MSFLIPVLPIFLPYPAVGGNEQVAGWVFGCQPERTHHRNMHEFHFVKCSWINMRIATEVGTVHHIFSYFFYRSHAGHHMQLHHCSASTVLGRHIDRFTWQQNSLWGQTILSAIHAFASTTGNFHLCVLLTAKMLGFLNMDLCFPILHHWLYFAIYCLLFY